MRERSLIVNKNIVENYGLYGLLYKSFTVVLPCTLHKLYNLPCQPWWHSSSNQAKRHWRFSQNILIYSLYCFWCPNTGNFHMIGDDLVNSYHLLLCCLDLVYSNASLCANKKDLINPYFKGNRHGHIFPSPKNNLRRLYLLCSSLNSSWQRPRHFIYS